MSGLLHYLRLAAFLKKLPSTVLVNHGSGRLAIPHGISIAIEICILGNGYVLSNKAFHALLAALTVDSFISD